MGERVTIDGELPARGYAWFVVIVLSLINMVSYAERQILTLLFTPIKKDFGLSDTQVSLLAGAAFVIFFVLFGLLFGRLADRANRKRIIAVGMLFWSAATTVCGLAQNFLSLFLARISVGIGEATLSPSALSIVSDLFPRNRLARATSIYTGAQYIGAGLALVVGGFAIKLATGIGQVAVPAIGTLHPWQLTFVIVGLGGLLFIVPLIAIREPVRRGAAVATADLGPRQHAWFTQFFSENRRTLLSHFAGFSLNTMLGFGLVAWIPTFFIRVHGWSAQDIGYAYGSITAVMGLCGALSGGHLAEWLESRGVEDVYFRLPMITTSANAVIVILAVLVAPTAAAALLLLALSTFVGTLSLPLVITSLQAISPNQVRGQLVATFYLVANLVGVAGGPTVVALLTDYVYRDEHAVGWSLATASIVVTPVIVAILGSGRASLRASLARASTYYAADPGPSSFGKE